MPSATIAILFVATMWAAGASPASACGYGDFVSVRDTLRPNVGGQVEVGNDWGFLVRIDIKPDCRIVWVIGKGDFPPECLSGHEFWASGRLTTSELTDELSDDLHNAGIKRRVFMLRTQSIRCE